MVIAILGTTVFFMSNQQLARLPNLSIDQSSLNPGQPQIPGTSTTADQSSPSTTDATTETASTTGSTGQLAECEQYNIDPCTEQAILAKRRLIAAQEFSPESFGLSNVHIWVAPDDHTSVAAMVVTNQGSNEAAIKSISVKGISVPYDAWYYNKADVTSASIDVPLKPDFTPSSVNIDADPAEETFVRATEPILLESGKSVVLYLLNPAGITGWDAGIAYNVRVALGETTKVVSVSVTTTTE